MITERKRKKFLPYFLLSIVFFYLFHCLFVFYQKAPDLSSSTDVLGIAKFDWLINNFTYKVFLNIHFTSFSRSKSRTVLSIIYQETSFPINLYFLFGRNSVIIFYLLNEIFCITKSNTPPMIFCFSFI